MKEGQSVKFSQRIGKKEVKVEIQKEQMDMDLRISIWNVLSMIYLEDVKSDWISKSHHSLLFRMIWISFLKYPLDTLDDYFDTTYKKMREWFFKWEWYEVYDFIEFIAKNYSQKNELFVQFCNLTFERELSAYRFINNEIVEITDESEIAGIEEAIAKSQQSKFSGVKVHLTSALSKLSDRKNPDYRNSIKESISAVESICQIICGDPKAELGKALKLIEDKLGMHAALKKGFSSIYGYTSDEGGIRHAMLDETTICFEDAKYMLVACSAFVNYLIVKSSKAGINV